MRIKPTPEADFVELEDYCLDSGLVSDKSEVPSFLEEVQAPFLPILEADGYTSAQAKSKMNEVFADASEFLKISATQDELEARIRSTIGSRSGTMSPYEVFRLLPGFIGLADIDVGKFVVAGLEPDGDWERTHPVMRYFQLWDGKVSKEHVIRRLMQTDKVVAAHPLALYSKELVERLSDPLLNEVFAFIEGHRDVLPVLSAVPISAMPEQFTNYATKFPIKSEMHSDNIVPVRRVNNHLVLVHGCRKLIMKPL